MCRSSSELVMEALSPREHQRERGEIHQHRAGSTADVKPI
jgi:hypothetical protein